MMMMMVVVTRVVVKQFQATGSCLARDFEGNTIT